jgi:hypothetical protein
MINNKLFRFFCFLVFVFIGILFVSPQTYFTNSVNNVQYNNPSIQSIYGTGQSSIWSEYSTSFDEGLCGKEGTDLILMIPPMGCEPMAVRSDLLAEQNVPVMCQLASIRVNPLIRVSSIKSIGFSGQNPKEVAGVSFYPSRAGIRSYNTLLGDPVYNNVGYVTLILKRNADEKTMPKFVEGNLTARITYDAEKAFGVGNAVLYLDEEDGLDSNKFWNGLGSIKLISVDNNNIKVALYDKNDRLIREVILKEGETSGNIYLPGFYCQASLRLKLSELTSPEDSAQLNIDGNSIWVRKGSKILNGRCTVRDLKLYSGQTGSVLLDCSGIGRIELSLLGSHSAKISLEPLPQEIVLSDNYNISNFILRGHISKNPELNWYLGYVNSLPSEDSIIVLLGSSGEIRSEVYSRVTKEIEALIERESKIDDSDLTSIIKNMKISGFHEDTNIVILRQGESKEFTSLSEKITLKFNGLIETNSLLGADDGKTSEITSYLGEADKAVKELLDNYPQVRGDLNLFGEIALLEQIDLVHKYGESYDHIALMEKFLEKYSSSVYADMIRNKLYQERNFDSKNARTTFEINGNFYSIILNQFKSVGEDSKNAVIFSGSNRLGAVSEGQELELSRESKEFLRILKIYPNRVDVEFLIKEDKGKFNKKSQFVLRLDEPLEIKIGGVDYLFSVSDIQIKAIAKVEILGDLNNKASEVNFTYKIGIEQRTIQLNPNKSSEKAEKLNKTIQKLEEKNNKLGELIKGWKGVCLATGLALNIKNLVSGYSGESLARQEVMAAWRSICAADKTTTTLGTPRSTDACYSAFSSEIEKDVVAYTKAIKEINDQINAEPNITKFIASFGGESIIELPGGASLEVSKLRTWGEVRVYLLYKKLNDNKVISTTIKDYVKIQRNTKLQYLLGLEAENNANAQGSSHGIFFGKDEASQNKNIRSWSREYLDLLTPTNIRDEIKKDHRSRNVPIAGERRTIGAIDKFYILILNKEPTTSESAKVIDVYNISENKVTKLEKEDPTYLTFSSYNYKLGDCDNKITTPAVSYYDSGSSKGLAAMVPFDINKGWYVRVSSSQGGIVSSESKGYTSSAIPETFSICNVGSDGIQSGDDSCLTTSINNNLGKDNEYINVAGCLLRPSELNILLRDAQEALRQANRQYSNKGNIKISISGRESFEAVRGTPGAQDGPIEQCQDFMSPGDCQTLYNVCDPVMCPTSRCNFGGKYPVSNVIQSGIIGSLTLCLPNFKLFGGDVYVPICLTGVHAGLDAYISILKAQRDCLAENAKSGRYTGMCDYMTAVYKCNLFWNQVAPFTSELLPSLLSSLSGRQKAGGGEYLTFQKSWNNMESSLNYFKNTYGSTSFTAFKFGNVENMGAEVCNAYVGTSFPTTAESLDKMLQPESPYQIYAEFQEIPHTDATIPPTAQYKVFAHIYAGKDQGVGYSVYLRSPPSSSYYAGIPVIGIPRTGTGFIPQGEQIQISEDFTAPAGYKELCVSVNGKEHCNFGPVTTDFGVSLLTDSYVNKQTAMTEIKTEKECQQGTSGVVGFSSINPQAAVTNVVEPRLDLKGIVRICSSVNPGEGTSKKTNWESVGYCGDKSISCWLDRSSVSDATGQILDVAGTVSAAEKKLYIINEGVTLSESDSLSKIIEIKKSIASLDKSFNIDLILKDITSLEEKGYSNKYQAEAIYWKFKLYEHIILKIMGVATPLSSSAVRDIGSPSVEDTVKKFEELIPGDFIVKDGVTYKVKTNTLDDSNSNLVLVIKGESSGIPKVFVKDKLISVEGYSWSKVN